LSLWYGYQLQSEPDRRDTGDMLCAPLTSCQLTSKRIFEPRTT
jgi:hypothetical protein